MKTQLLEDIGQSATLSLVPSGKVSIARPPQAVQDQAGTSTPVRPRPALGVWRQKPAGEMAAPLEAPPAIEPLVRVETQQPAPPQPPETAIAPGAPALAANAMQKEPAPQGPVFDFTPPLSMTPTPDLFIHEPSWFERSGRSYLLWGAFVLAVALIFQGGVWLYGESKDASALAVVASESKAAPQFDKAAKQRAIGAKEFTLGGDGTVQVTPAAPAVPPLVLLEPAQATAAKVEPAAEQAAPVPSPRRVRQTEPEQFIATSKPARARAREPVVQTDKKPGADAVMAATLKACREHGYHAAQCVKRGCSVTKYGFVCPGT